MKPAIEAEQAATRILLSETEQTVFLGEALSLPLQRRGDLALAIGPEGGWTADEMALFTEHAWTHVTLGPRILRAETAAIAAVAIVGASIQ